MKLSLAIASDTQEKQVLRAWSEVLARGEKDTYVRVYQNIPACHHVSTHACRDVMNDLLERGMYPVGAEP